jgi:hypothetical protein
MASPPSRIPVPAQHSRIPVLGPALYAAHPSRTATSSSTPFRALRAASDATFSSASNSVASATHPSRGIGASSDMRNNVNADDQAWGKIERLRTRRVFSEGTGELAASPTPLSGTVDNVPTFGYRPFSPGMRQSSDSTSAEQRKPTHRSTPDTPDTVQSSSTSEGPVRRRVTSPQRHAQHATGKLHNSPDHRKQSLPSDSSAMLSRPARDRRRIPSDNAPVNDMANPLMAKVDSTDKPSNRETIGRPKLVSNESIDGWGMLALGFERKDESFGSQHSIGPLDAQHQADYTRRNISAMQASVSSTGSNQGEPTMFLERPETDSEAVISEEAGPRTAVQSSVPTQPRRRAFDIPRALPSSGDNGAPDGTQSSMTTASGHNISSEIPAMSDTDPSDSGSKPAIREYLATTAEKRHQPQLRLVSMPNIPALRAPGVLQLPRRSGSGASPPIPPKSPLRQPGSFVASPTSRDSNATTSGFLTPNSAYATPSETPGIAILDRPPEATTPSQEPRSGAGSPPFGPKRKDTGRQRPEGFYLASSETADIYQQFSEFGQEESGRTAASVRSPDDTLQLGFGTLRDSPSVLSVS